MHKSAVRCGSHVHRHSNHLFGLEVSVDCPCQRNHCLSCIQCVSGTAGGGQGRVEEQGIEI